MWHRILLTSADGFFGIDSLFKRRLEKVVPRFQSLIDDPQGYLLIEDMRIGPGNHYFTGFAFGTVLGLILSCGLSVEFLRDQRPILERPIEQQFFSWLMLIAGPIAGIAAMLFWLRGGEIILRKHEVEFRFRNVSVVCPWELFHAPGEPVWLDFNTLAMTANPNAIDQVVMRDGGVDLQTGSNTRTKQFRFRLETCKRITNDLEYPEIVLRDLYKARLNEIGSLILILSRELAISLERKEP
jgi:hypothetical protein